MEYGWNMVEYGWNMLEYGWSMNGMWAECGRKVDGIIQRYGGVWVEYAWSMGGAAGWNLEGM